jgi:hypothetical protein
MHENQKISTSQSFCDLRFKQQNRGNLRISRLLPGCARVFQQTLKPWATSGGRFGEVHRSPA